MSNIPGCVVVDQNFSRFTARPVALGIGYKGLYDANVTMAAVWAGCSSIVRGGECAGCCAVRINDNYLGIAYLGMDYCGDSIT